MKTKLSPVQLDVLQRLASCDEPLVYFRGGFWSLQSIGEAGLNQGLSPSWYVAVGTVKALERAGLLKRMRTATNYPIGHYPQLANRVLSAKGLAMATGTEAPAHGLVEAIAAYTGHVLHYSSYSILNEQEWEVLMEHEPSLSDGTAAFISDSGDIKIHSGYESDALHELVHAAGVKPEPTDTTFICEGITQVATEAIAKRLSLSVRHNYKDEVAFVQECLIPATNLKPHDLVVTYIDYGLDEIAGIIAEPFRDEFELLVKELRQAVTGIPGPVLSSYLQRMHR